MSAIKEAIDICKLAFDDLWKATYAYIREEVAAEAVLKGNLSLVREKAAEMAFDFLGEAAYYRKGWKEKRAELEAWMVGKGAESVGKAPMPILMPVLKGLKKRATENAKQAGFDSIVPISEEGHMFLAEAMLESLTES